MTETPANDGPDGLPLRIRGLADRVGNALSAAQAGKALDLGGLDADVAAICDAVQKSSPDIARDCAQPLKDLLGDLDRLGLVLRDAVGHASQDSAAAAYARNAPPSQKPKS